MKESDDSAEVQAFMAAYHRLRDRIADDPETLVSKARKDYDLANLCGEISMAYFSLSVEERSRREPFSAPTNPAFVDAYRDFEARYFRLVIHAQVSSHIYYT